MDDGMYRHITVGFPDGTCPETITKTTCTEIWKIANANCPNLQDIPRHEKTAGVCCGRTSYAVQLFLVQRYTYAMAVQTTNGPCTGRCPPHKTVRNHGVIQSARHMETVLHPSRMHNPEGYAGSISTSSKTKKREGRTGPSNEGDSYGVGRNHKATTSLRKTTSTSSWSPHKKLRYPDDTVQEANGNAKETASAVDGASEDEGIPCSMDMHGGVRKIPSP